MGEVVTAKEQYKRDLGLMEVLWMLLVVIEIYIHIKIQKIVYWNNFIVF